MSVCPGLRAVKATLFGKNLTHPYSLRVVNCSAIGLSSGGNGGKLRVYTGPALNSCKVNHFC
jgi:hypothetical protein